MRTKSIDTVYAGCNFRSRLEARWAVFFDHLDIAWRYEPQGYEVDTNGGLDDVERYLPDFYLPQLKTFVEVKGEMLERDLRRLCKGVIPHGLSLGANGIPAVIILGDLPRVRTNNAPAHVGLYFHKGDVWASRYVWLSSGSLYSMVDGEIVVGTDAGDVHFNHRIASWLTNPGDTAHPNLRQVVDAYTAARSARFEFGATR